MTVSAVRPWRRALRRECSLPSGVVGPVLLSALRRLASICLSELIEDQLELGSFFRHEEGPARGIGSRRFWVRLFPKPLGDFKRVDLEILPPGHLIASLMQLPMMTAAERDGEFIADFETEGSGLRESQVMRIGWLPAADETGL